LDEKFIFAKNLTSKNMYWTLELASYLSDAPWPAEKDELIDYAIRTGAPLEVVENLQDIEDEGEIYENIEDIWPDYIQKEDFFHNEEDEGFDYDDV
jgi:hypothetical protein